MSTTDQIYLATGLSPEEAAPRIADALGMELVSDHLGVQVVGPLPWSEEPWFGGNVSINYEPVLLEDETPETYEPSVMDGYDVVWHVGSSSRADDVIHRGSRDLFDALVARLSWPALLVFNAGRLVAAAEPGGPATEFPPDTSPDAPSRDLWAPYARWPPQPGG